MYSPRINVDLIPRIYKLAKAKGIKMTTLVNEILRKALDDMEGKKDEYLNEQEKRIKYTDF